jgi:alkyl hydroperoxide reductase subunit F
MIVLYILPVTPQEIYRFLSNSTSCCSVPIVETNERGEVKVDRHGQTGVRGIFAAGDATDGHDKQIVIAAGEGAAAALAAFEYLVKQV